MDGTLPHFINHNQRSFCSRCGTSLVLQYRGYASGREPNSRLCGSCRVPLPGLVGKDDTCYGRGNGFELPETSDPINQVERRYLSIMFCDLVNWTGLVTRLDPEDLLQLIQTYRNLCVETIKYYGGFTAGYAGDGTMSYFGYPRTHEDDAERAVYAALDLLNSVKTRKTELAAVAGNSISVRIGIASGLVVVGNSTGTGSVLEKTVIGQAPNLAARLQSMAQPGTAIVSTATRNLVQNRFRLKNIGMNSLAGFEKTQVLWQVVDETDASTRFHNSRHINEPGLVGRDEEFKHMIRQWNRVRCRDGRVVLICGETGIGKSKLLETLCVHVSRESCNRFVYRCSPLYRNNDMRSCLARLQATVGSVSGYTGARQSLTGNPGETRPCLIILEDAQWLTPAALELVTELIMQIPGKPVLLAISHRLHFRPPAPWLERGHVEKISLSPINRSAAELLIRQIAGEIRIPAPLVSRIVNEADGIPFFLEELTRTALQAWRPGNRILPQLPEDTAIPEKVRTVLMTRLDQDSSSREAAQICAALGREFSYDMLAKVWPHNPKKLDLALNSLCSSGLLSKTGNGNDARYAFKWTLMRAVAYQSMLKRVRQKLHRRISEIMLEHFPEYARLHPELLNHHSARAGERGNR